MSTFRFHGYNVWYNESGEGSPLIFLHNGGNDHRIWDHQVTHFSATRRVIVLDHLGFGNSDSPFLDYTLPLYSDQVKSLIEHLNEDKATLVGHCIGAAMSLHYTVRQPERVERLILFNTATERTLCAGPLRQAYRTFSKSRLMLRLFLLPIRLFGLSEKRSAEVLRGQYSNNSAGPEPEFERYMHKLYNEPGQMRALYNSFANWKTWGEIDELDKPVSFPPVMLIWGEDNEVLPLTGGKEFARELRPDRFEILAACGHMTMREQPGRVNALIESFLSAPGG